MARKRDAAGEVIQALEQAEAAGEVSDLKLAQEARRVQAMSMKIAGFSYEQIGKRLGINHTAARNMILGMMAEATANQDVMEQRELENMRLDRAQAAIWPAVLDADLKAVAEFTKLSQRRAQMNGLDAPKQFQIAANVRVEMETALQELKEIVLTEVITDEE